MAWQTPKTDWKIQPVDDSWKSMFEASGDFDEIDCQIEGLGRIDAVEQLYVAHTQAAIDSIAK